MNGARVVVIGLALLASAGCSRAREVLAELREGSAASTDEAQVAPLPVFEFSEASAEQRAMYAAALDALRNGRESEAITALVTLRDMPPPSEVRASGVLILADRYFVEGRYDDAIATLDFLASTSPPAAELEFLRGRTLIELGRDADAEDALRRATRLDADFLRPYAVLAVLLADNGRLDEAADAMLAHDRAVARIADGLSAGNALDVRLAAVELLSRGWRDDSVSRALEPALSDPSFEVVAAALDAFVDVGTPISAETLSSMQQRVDPELRERLEAALQAVGGAVPVAMPDDD